MFRNPVTRRERRQILWLFATPLLLLVFCLCASHEMRRHFFLFL